MDLKFFRASDALETKSVTLDKLMIFINSCITVWIALNVPDEFLLQLRVWGSINFLDPSSFCALSITVLVLADSPASIAGVWPSPAPSAHRPSFATKSVGL